MVLFVIAIVVLLVGWLVSCGDSPEPTVGTTAQCVERVNKALTPERLLNDYEIQSVGALPRAAEIARTCEGLLPDVTVDEATDMVGLELQRKIREGEL